MIKKRAKLIFGLILLSCACFTTCNIENPIIEPWWRDDPDYIPIIKSVPNLIYQTITEDRDVYVTVYEQLPPEVQTQYVYETQYEYIDVPVPPEVMLQYIDIIDIEFIIFAGDSRTYNEVPSPTGGTALTAQERDSNTTIVNATISALNANSDYMLILHGHANPVTGTAAEAADLAELSQARADSVKAQFSSVEPPERITAKGYGGERNISGSSSSYASLNRRVEVILFTVSSEQLPSTDTGG